jgi:hypothetical protein
MERLIREGHFSTSPLLSLWMSYWVAHSLPAHIASRQRRAVVFLKWCRWAPWSSPTSDQWTLFLGRLFYRYNSSVTLAWWWSNHFRCSRCHKTNISSHSDGCREQMKEPLLSSAEVAALASSSSVAKPSAEKPSDICAGAFGPDKEASKTTCIKTERDRLIRKTQC